ncbi:MAG: tRNA pseudouridine(55) synthase TruB [Phycisphaerales bacterium]|nr:tRNA pseudouridine(55) synthase TruB [Phycisphaerales bacterium]
MSEPGRIEGVLNFHKPIGITSAKALYAVRRIVREKRSGHAGTLDPLADGVLLLCFGRATRLVERLMNLRKGYEATIRLDVTSDSLDADSPLVAVSCAQVPTAAAVREALATLVGAIQQVPPAVSALKIGGVPAYKLARSGQPPELSARTVQVYSADLIAYDWPVARIRVECGRGTYIRAMARDLGGKLGCGGCITALTRTFVGPFDASGGWTLERLSLLEQPQTALQSVQTVMEMMPDPTASGNNSLR